MKHFSKLVILSLIVSAVILIINGCATIFGWGGPELVNIRSTPDQAKVLITDESGTDVFEGTTPTNVTLEKKKGFFSGKTYTLKISKEGYSDKVIMIDTQANGWYLGGNLVFGGLIGWFIVDPATGAMWTFDTNEVNATLEEMKEGSIDKAMELKVLLLQDVPESIREKMIRIEE